MKTYICDRQREECCNKSYCDTLCTTTSDPKHSVQKRKPAKISIKLLINKVLKRKPITTDMEE